ncbi:TPA: hypothetical protein ACPJ0I_003996 [Vibrio diabolicus]|uniref:defense against restriction DarA-related protein n=1 Tax=Vibrio TaxID=662 RepID=UPI002074E572|nr:hypothetical protein [Vibrio sp. SCSIO 43009]USD77338.1 hypothetical protein J4N43_23730 [Vibrio sp. SCSIO 43009]
MMFTSQNQIKIVDRIDHLAKKLTPEQIEAVLQGKNADQILEALSLEDLENTYLYQCKPVPQMMLEAFKSKASRLELRAQQFGKHLERKTPTLSVEAVEVGKPRKSGAVAVQMVKIPFSDGQSISIAFHAPDNDPLKINPDDTLIAFRFLMNSRDITHVVAPKGNMDLSLKEVTNKLAQLLENNSEKFVAAKAKKDADKKALEEAQQKAQELDEQAAQLGEEATDLEQKLDELAKKEKRLETQIATHNEIQEELRKQLAAIKPAANTATKNVNAGGSSSQVIEQWDASWTKQEKRDFIINRAFNDDLDAFVKQLSQEFQDSLEFAGAANQNVPSTYSESYINDVIYDLDKGAMTVSELAEAKEYIRDSIENDFPQLSDEEQERKANIERKEWLLALIGRKTIAKGWKMDKGEDSEPFVYFESPDANDDDSFGQYMIHARDNQTLAVTYGEGSPLAGGDDLQGWEAAKSLILADYDRESKLLQDTDDNNEEPQPIENDEPNANDQDKDETTDNLFWYGLRLRPYGLGTTPPQHQVAKYLDPESAKEQFADAGNGIRHGAIAYDQKLPPELVSNFDLEPLFGMVEGDLEEAERIATEALGQWVEDKGVDEIPQSTLDTLKQVGFKAAFAKQLRQQPEMKNRKENPNAYKLWSASIDLVTPDMIQEIAEDLMLVQSDAELQRQAEHTQGRMRFQEAALSQLKDMQSVNPSDRKRLVMLADLTLGTGKTLKRGEKVDDQAKRISEQAHLVESLQGETLASLEAQFKNRKEITDFLTAHRIPFNRRAKRADLLQAILNYRDGFFSATAKMFDLRALRGDLYEKFENGEALALDDVEKAFSATTVYHEGDVAYTKAKGETVIPAMADQGEDYQKVERFIKAIDDGIYPDLSELSSDELFAQHYAMASVTNQDILAIHGFRYLDNDEQIDNEQMARAIHNSVMPLWYTKAIEAEYESRGFPSLAALPDLNHKGQFKATREKRYAPVGTIGQSDFSVIDTYTGKVLETGLEGAAAQQKATQLNDQAVKESTIAIFNMLKDGKTLEQIAETEYSAPLEPVSPAMFTTINGFESLYSTLAINGSGSLHSRPTLRENADKLLAKVDADGKINDIALTEEQENQMENTFGYSFFSAKSNKGKELRFIANTNSRSYLTVDGANKLLELLGAKNAVESDTADEVSKGASEEEKQLLALDPTQYSFGSIYESEGIRDTGEIAKRTRAFIAQLKKAGKISNDVKISVRKPRYGTLDLTLTDLPRNVMLCNPAYLQFEIDNPNSPAPHGMSRYTEAVDQLIEFVNAYVGQYDYNNSDTMTDYHDRNFFGGHLTVDFDFGKERKVVELASLTEMHQQGEQAEDDALDVTSFRESLDEEEAKALEQLEAFTNLELKLGKQEVTFPTGRVKSINAKDEDGLTYSLDVLFDILATDLSEKAKAQLETIKDWQSSDTYYNEKGTLVQPSVAAGIHSVNGSVPANVYAPLIARSWLNESHADIYPIAKDGEYKFALYQGNDLIGEFDDTAEMEALLVKAFNLSSEAPQSETEGNNEEMEHVEKLKEIRDFTGEPTPELVDEFQTALEQAYAHFEANDQIAENEALMDAALSNITSMIQAQI